MGDDEWRMPADFLADRRAEGIRLRRQLARMLIHVGAIVGFAVVMLVPLMTTARARRQRADAANLMVREAHATTVGLKTRERWAQRIQSQQALIQEARDSRRRWLSLIGGMANYLPPDTWLTGATCAADEEQIKADLSGASWSIDHVTALTSTWERDPNAQAVTLKSMRNAVIDDVPAVQFELTIRYGPKEAPAAAPEPTT